MRAVRLCISLLLALLTAAGAPAGAASQWANLANPVFLRIGTSELSNPVIQALGQDPSGLLWVGTAAGLASYDGYQFRSFVPTSNGPRTQPAPDIVKMLIDPQGGLWLGTASSGLLRFDFASEAFRAWRTDSTGRAGPRSVTIWALAQAGARVWIGGDGGLDRFDPRTNAFTRVELVQSGTQPVVRSLLVDRSGTLWIGTDRGLFYRPLHSADVHAFMFPGANGAIPRQPVWSLYEDSDGRLWAGSFDSVFAIDRAGRLDALFRSSRDLASIAPGLERAITEFSHGIMWIGSSQGGVSIIDLATRRVRRLAGNQSGPGELGADVVWQWLRDRAGAVWVAGYNGGLFLHNPLARGIYTLPADRPETGLNNTQARAVAAEGQHLWVGGLDGSLVAVDPERGRLAKLHLPKTPTALTSAVDGSLWIGTQTGLCRLRQGSVTCPAGPDDVRASWVMAVLDTPHTLWVGTQTGLVAQDKSGGAVAVYRAGPRSSGLSNSFITALSRDRAGRLWIGTINGLNQIDTRSGRLVPIQLAPGSSLQSGFIESIAEDKYGRIWVGTYGIPSMRLQDSARGFVVRHIGRGDGLPESVDGLASDASSRLWASLDNPGGGIALIDSDARAAVRVLGPPEGVSIDQYAVGAVTRANDGTIFFGGLKGVTVIAPGAVPASPENAPPLVATALQLGRRSVPAFGVNHAGASVELPSGAREITLEFAALDYTAPQALRYAYKLEGFDRDWISADATHRIATYTNLPPGDYTLEVRNTNQLGVWSGRVLKLRVHALPAWYEAIWFRALLVILLVAALVGLHGMRIALLRRRQRELEGIVRDRTRELEAANVKLEEMSLTDPLTGLRNRRFLTQHVETDVAAALRDPTNASLHFFMVDIDHFKAVNDEFGHRAGDLVLMQMRERLREVFRESDMVVRWGGEEFLAIARGGNWGIAIEIAERIRRAVSDRAFSLDGSSSLAKSASIGFATFPFVASQPRAISWSQVVELADRGLYMAKNGGRNTWVGIAANGRTDPALLARRLATSAEEVVDLGEVEVFRRRSEDGE
jgi:diguanylate cyclase (GGDEF)-like protein